MQYHISKTAGQQEINIDLHYRPKIACYFVLNHKINHTTGV